MLKSFVTLHVLWSEQLVVTVGSVMCGVVLFFFLRRFSRDWVC